MSGASSRYVDLDGSGGTGLPPGGTTGQVLTKESNADYDADWENASSGNVATVVGSDQITVDDTDPANPVVHTHNQTTGNDDGLVESVVAGTNVTVDNTDPKNPVISASGGGGGTTLTESVITAAGYTLVLTDAGKILSLDNASAQTLTIPLNATVAFPVGTVIYLNNLGAGLWQLAAAVGVTLHSPYGKVQLATQYAQATLWKRATDEWQLEGNLA